VWRLAGGLLAVLACVGIAGAAESGPASPAADVIGRTRNAYLKARARYQSDTNDFEASWHFARACFDYAMSPTNNAERAKIAEEGIALSRRLVATRPNQVEGHYYLGMNIGQLADTKRNLAGLRMVKEMEREFEAARQLDEQFDYAGPDRNLGLLYFEAPTLISVGSRTRARRHLLRSVELAPDFPEDRLYLIEAYLKWGDRDEALAGIKALEELLPEARKKYSGEDWAVDWLDWEKRLDAAKRKLGLKTAGSPKHQSDLPR
jgi:tetratricopeptide (TPR) repeat protein